MPSFQLFKNLGQWLRGENTLSPSVASAPTSSVSTGNSTTEPLSAGATFTGTAELNDYPDVMVSCQTDEGGTLFFDFSVDGTNWGSFPVGGFELTSNIHEFHTAVKGPRYFRVRLINGGTDQTTLRLKTFYGVFAGKPNAPLGQSINDDSDATVVKSLQIGKQPDDSYANAKVTGSAFSTATPPNDGVTFDSGVLDNRGFQQVQTNILADQDGVLTFTFYEDAAGTDAVRTLSLPYIASNGYQQYSAPTFSKYVRYQFLNNSGANQTDFYYETLFLTSALNPQQLRLDAPMAAAMISQLTRSVIAGKQPSGGYANASLDETGAFLTTIQNPVTAFGELQIAEVNPIAQADAVYGLLDNMEVFTATGGTVSVVDGNFVCATGVSVGGYGVTRCRRALRYRPGQGSLFRFTALFDSANDVSLSLQLAGAFNSTNGFFIGYHDAQGLGVMHRYGGAHEIRELAITTPAAGSETVDLELNTVTYSIPVTSGTAQHNAYEIAEWMAANQSVWEAKQNDGKVILFNLNAAPAAGSYSVTSTGSFAGSITQQSAGVANTEDWTYQSAWSEDMLDGTGPSGITLDPDLGNVYEINLQYLGYGEVSIAVENPATGRLSIFHKWKFANSRTTPTLNNPTLKVGWVAASLGSTTNIQVKGASLLAAVQGKIHPFRRPAAEVNTRTAVGTTLVSIVAIRVRTVFSGSTQLSEVLPKLAYLTPEGSKTCEVKVLFNPTFDAAVNEPNWTYHNETDSIVEYDTTATELSDEGEILAAFTTFGGVPASINFSDLAEEGINPLHLERGDVLCIAARMTGGATQDIAGSITWLED